MIPSVRTTAALALFLAALPFSAQAVPSGFRPDLGSAVSFAVLGATTVTNTGASQLTGNVGVSPGTAVTGFPPAIFTSGAIYAGGPVAVQAQKDVALTYADLAGRPYLPANDLSGRNLGGLTLAPGVYHFGTSAQLTGQLTFDARGNRNAFFIIQIGTTLTTGSNSNVKLIGGANRENIFWQAGSSVTLGVSSTIQGNILVYTSITASTTTTVHGRLLAENGAVTLDTDAVAINIWQVADIAVGSDDNARILWNTPDGRVTLASMDNGGLYGLRYISLPHPGFTAAAVACGADNLTRVLWTYLDGSHELALYNADNSFDGIFQFAGGGGWSAVDISVGSDNQTRILRTNLDGRISVWTCDSSADVTKGPIIPAFTGWTATRIACGSDGLTRVLLTKDADGSASIVLLNADNSFQSNLDLDPNPGWTAMDISMGADNKIRLLWTNGQLFPLVTTADEAMMLWTIDADGAYKTTPTSESHATWNVLSVATGSDNLNHVLWSRTDGAGDMWLMNNTQYQSLFYFER